MDINAFLRRFVRSRIAHHAAMSLVPMVWSIFVFCGQIHGAAKAESVHKRNPGLIDSSYYGKANVDLAAAPKNYLEILNDIGNKGWKDDLNIMKLITDNSDSLELFRKATLETDGESILGEAFIFRISSQYYSTTHYAANYLSLARLLILEGKYYEAKGLPQKAKEDYLAVTRFMIHLSGQHSEVKWSTAISSILLNLAESTLMKSYPDDEVYRKSLLDNLRKIKSNQDFLSGAIHEDIKELKKYSRTIEEDAKKGASFEALFGLLLDNSEKKQIGKYRSKSKELNAMLDSEFFAEFYSQLDSRMDEIQSTALRAARENNGEMYRTKIDELRRSLIKKDMPTPLDYLLWSMENAANKGQNVKLMVADTMAKYCLAITMPSYWISINTYWEFNSKLDSLINKAAK
jgi:hypothetical protein